MRESRKKMRDFSEIHSKNFARGEPPEKNYRRSSSSARRHVGQKTHIIFPAHDTVNMSKDTKTAIVVLASIVLVFSLYPRFAGATNKYEDE